MCLHADAARLVSGSQLPKPTFGWAYLENQQTGL